MKAVDLTLTISEKLPMFPGSPLPQFIEWSELKKHGYNLELIFMSSHSGTHIDAPFHFYQDGRKVNEIPADRLVCNSYLIKIRRTSGGITKLDIIKYEKVHGKIPENVNVIFQTDWQQNLEKKKYFLKNPGLTISAANYLVKKDINLVGIDSPSIDLGKNSNFPVHKILAKNDILIVENLCNLKKIKQINFKLGVFPLKLKGATGSPVRAMAF